ncbi:hypothetical protein Sa4125_30470 [Aureimonas sp. SA4125]|uniref:DUF433 domain-containing protein n=1 Tax=Aureimonas sp. SA4125 TaxID=2826993 RepID=UPI001CC39D8F|nr:DUF433 domain-containing protein [Aureimonas sp. SA4125]BDA85505.1 hypothetical protein Sa4125_30470 [Aureimonas sp. SA4125]
MAEIFFTSDHHFGHRGIIAICDRPFLSVDDMDEELIRRWNARVRKGDVVYHLGDFTMGASAERGAEIFGRLHGRKHLIIGNHDREKVRTLPWASAPRDRLLLRHPGETLPLVLDHYAMRTWPGLHYGAVHLYGHSHGALPGLGRSIDVGVDVWHFRPVGLDELRPILERQHEELERERDAARMFRERAARGDPAKALEILARVPDVAPDSGDEVVPYAGPDTVDAQAETFARLWQDNREASAAGVGYSTRVFTDPAVLGGEPHVSGTTVPARIVLDAIRDGDLDFEILAAHPTLPEDAVHAVREWAARREVPDRV